MADDQGNHNFDASRSQSPSINSQSYAIPVSDDTVVQLSECSSVEVSDDFDDEDSNPDDHFLDSVVPETSNAFFMDSQDPGSMFDVSKYIFESLSQAIDSADFSDAISLQTKTSAVINSKSLELKHLIQTTRLRLEHFKERFETGARVTKTIHHNLQYSKERIDRINSVIGTKYPIEFNQAKEKVIERQSDDTGML